MIDMVQVAPAEHDMIACYRAASQALDGARQLAAAKDAPRAAARYREALAAIARCYVSASLLDDTSTKLTLAEMRAGEDIWDQALTLFDRVVVSRLTLLGQRISDKH